MAENQSDLLDEMQEMTDTTRGKEKREEERRQLKELVLKPSSSSSSKEKPPATSSRRSSTEKAPPQPQSEGGEAAKKKPTTIRLVDTTKAFRTEPQEPPKEGLYKTLENIQNTMAKMLESMANMG